MRNEAIYRKPVILSLLSGWIFVTLFTYFPITGFAKTEIIDTDEGGQTAPEIQTEDFSRRSALEDPDNRISKDFKVPQALRYRTSFWFDVYTKYGEEEHIIHHVLYPWIVYKVVDVGSIPEKPKDRWYKYHAGRKLVRTETSRVRNTLKKLSKMKSYNKLTRFERNIFESLKYVRGPRQKVFRIASENVRVQLGQKDFIKKGLASSARYLPEIEKHFSEQNLPVELTRLPFVESSFNIRAESKVGASGIWQIMPATGKVKLRIDDLIDERNSPLKASVVAADLLKFNYKSLKDWPLAVTAYNHGAGGVRKALRASGAKNLPTLIGRYHEGSFKFASANFYTSFIAVLHAEKYHKEIFELKEDDYHEKQEHALVKLEKSMRFKNLLEKLQITADEFLDYNLDLRRAAEKNARIPKGFKIYLPADNRFLRDGQISLNSSDVTAVSI